MEQQVLLHIVYSIIQILLHIVYSIILIGLGGYLHYKFGSAVDSKVEAVVAEVKQL